MAAIPRFIQGVFSFQGIGLDNPRPLGPRAIYQVPAHKRAQLVYVRAGNSASELISLHLTRDGRPMRYFPLGAKASQHVSLAVTEDVYPESELELSIAAPEGIEGVLVVDLGLLEID